MKQLLFASSNKAKLAQFQFVADSCGLNVKVVSLYQKYPDINPYSEEYETQYEIVDNGAREIYMQAKKPIIVEDTILEVDALQGRPGLHASEYLQEKGREGLLREMEGHAIRTARITSIAGYFDGKIFVSSKNVITGNIATKESFREGEPAWVGPTYHPLGGGFNSTFIATANNKTIADHTAKEGLLYGYREPNFKVMLGLWSSSLAATS